MSPSVSIVVDWETGLECPRDRVLAGLAEIARQIREELIPIADGSPRAAPETIICFDRMEARADDIERILSAASGAAGPWPGTLRLVECAGAVRSDKYQKMNLAARHAAHDVLLFVDSDLLLEPGCLKHLLAPFDDYRKAVVVGCTHLDYQTTYERGVALSWIFDAPSEPAGLRPTHRLVANNIAFRRALIRRLPFPEHPTYRGQCSALGEALQAAGIVMYEQPLARASHPAPRGARAFVHRALYAGTDSHFYDTLAGTAGAARGLATWRGDLARVSRRIASRRAPLGAGALDVGAARLLGFAYYGLKAGAYLTRLGRRHR